MDDVPRENWMDALVSATNEVAVTALGYDEGTVQLDAEMSDSNIGSFVALAGEEHSLQMGLSGKRADVMTLCKSLLGMELGEEDLDDDDLTDALGEIVNLLVGGVKIRMNDAAPSMNIGLPLVWKGTIQACRGIELSTALIRWEPAQVHVLLLRHNDGG